MAPTSSPLILKFAFWPEVDREQWERCLRPGQLFDPLVGAFASWSMGTRRVHLQGYGSWLSFIARQYPHLLTETPEERVTKEIVHAFIEEGRLRLKQRSVHNQILSLAVIMRGFAPDHDFTWLWLAANRLYQQSDPTKLKPPLPVSASDLFGWSLKRLAELNTQTDPDAWGTATEFRQALTIGLLISCPVRARAFVAMTVKDHVGICDDQVILEFKAADMKDRKARRIPVPQALAPFLIDYLEVYRPLLLDGHVSEYLWISRRGNPLNQNSLTGGLAQLTEREFGVVMRPHAFRHVAATSIAVADPARAGIIRDVLGHATIRTSEKYYNRATAFDVSRHLQDILRTKRMPGERRGRRVRADHDVPIEDKP